MKVIEHNMNLLVQTGILAYLVLVCYLSTCEGIVCLRCDSVPFPRDCYRTIKCSSSEECYTEQVITESGNVVYNLGCMSRMNCERISSSGRRRYAVPAVEDVTAHFYDNTRTQPFPIAEPEPEAESSDILTCAECCAEGDHCNRILCKMRSGAGPNQMYCASCNVAISPEACEYIALCRENEICYSELININGDNRYRLGCIKPNACNASLHATLHHPVGSSMLVGRRDVISNDVVTGSSKYSRQSNRGPTASGETDFLQQTSPAYCGQCCVNNYDGCNSHLCKRDGSTIPGVNVSELVSPPEQKFCRDAFAECPIHLKSQGQLCEDRRYKNYACRETCLACKDNPGLVTSTPLPVINPAPLPRTDCFFDSAQYKGIYTWTYAFHPCVNWADVANLQFFTFPDGNQTSAGRFCRDPDGKGHPWCYTSRNGESWGFCPVPECKECYYQNRTAQYNGFVRTTKDGSECKNWRTDPAYNSASSVMVNSDNYCRDFGNVTGTPGLLQCFNGATYSTCEIDQCNDTCVDKVDCTNKYFCTTKYLAVTLCPKTCMGCSFGLQPAVTLPDPSDRCIDNPTYMCSYIASTICSVKRDAMQYCPKTCGLCDLLAQNATGITTSPTATKTTAPPGGTTIAQGSSTAHPNTWTAWGSWSQCQPSNTTCFNVRYRTCPSEPCQDGKPYDIRVCTCNVTTTTTTTTTTMLPVTTVRTTQQTTTEAQREWAAWSECSSSSNSSTNSLCFRVRNCKQNCPSPPYVIEQCPCPVTTTPAIATLASTEVTTTSVTVTPASTEAPCLDDPTADCNNPNILNLVCNNPPSAASLCPKACGLCGSCYDYLNCSSASARGLFCSDDAFSRQLCRQTCDKCREPPVPVAVNECFDPVASVKMCVDLHKNVCICKDNSIRDLCKNYCDGRCVGYQQPPLNCTITR